MADIHHLSGRGGSVPLPPHSALALPSCNNAPLPFPSCTAVLTLDRHIFAHGSMAQAMLPGAFSHHLHLATISSFSITEKQFASNIHYILCN